MERILNDNEKIRRAEEIYYRRNHRNVSISQREPKRQKTYLGSKILLEMLILVLLAMAVFAVKNKDYIFTENFLNNFAQYNINLTEKFNNLLAYFKEEENTNDVFINHEQTENNPDDQQESQAQPVQTQGSQVQQEAPQSVVTDVLSLKNLVHFIKPIEGIVSSGFGSRESQYQNVTGAHTGIDIAAPNGTKIKSAMTGTVTQVSTEGDYGNHIRITKENVTTLYAHCSEMYVSEGQEIVQGQEIASVGSTGNSTGLHLHFEIRIDNNPINPAEVIQF